MKWTAERRAAHSALLRELWSQGVYANRRPQRFNDGKCAICAKVGGLRHFSLTIQVQLPDRRHTARGAGSIDLCRRCWSEATSKAALRVRVPTPRRMAA